MRGVLAAAAAVAGYFSIAHTAAQVLMKSDVALAHQLAPWDGRITAAMATSLAGSDATPTDRQHAGELARLALRQDPTAVTAVSTLGLNAQLRGDTQGARRLFTYAEKLSRRDLPTQLWAIEDAVERDDIAGALRHYDIALRTKRQSGNLLFPVLAAASATPQVRAELVKTLAAKPLWADGFIAYIAANSTDPRSTAALFLGVRGAGLAIPEGAHARVINALLSGGFTEDAWRYYAAVRRGVDRRRSRDQRFAGADQALTAFDWVPINGSGMNTSIQRGEKGGIFDFMAPASIGGPLLQQVQMLPPGTYSIEGHGSGIDVEPGAQPYWALTCRSDGHELGRVVLPNSAQADGNFSGSFTVPAGCQVQVLTLMARASEGVSGLSGQIDRVQLAPAR